MPLLKCSASKAKPKNGITYITDPKKAKIVTVRNLFEDEDYAKQFEETAHRFRKGSKFDERKYYHFKLSCARKDNVSPKLAHQYAEEIAKKLFEKNECVIATHTDTQTVHSHIIVNSVDPITGKKLQFSPKEYAEMKDEANRIGRKYGFTETEFRKRGKNSRTATERKILLKGGVSWKEELREVIAEGTRKSKTPEQFKKYLDQCYGVKITRDGKDYSYLHPNKQKPIRGEKLGTNYTKTEVLRKLGEQNNRNASSTNNRGRSKFIGKSGGNRTVRTSKIAYGGGAGVFITAGLDSIEREMQQLSRAAECAGQGTDAASEERKMAEQRARDEAERRRREAAERLERQQLSSVGEPENNAETDNGSCNADSDRINYSYGKGD